VSATKRRSSKGKGSLYKDTERGTWVGAAVVNGQRIRVRAKTKLEAREKLTAAMRGEPTTTPAAALSAGLTVKVLVDDWRRRLPKKLAPSTRSRHRWACSLITEVLGHLEADAVKVGQVEDALQMLADRGLGAASLVQIRSTLRQVFADALRRGEVSRNPVDKDTRIPDNAKKATRRDVLTPQQARQLLEVLQADDTGLPYLLQLRLGLRPGEAFALHWESVNLDTGTLTVSRGLQRTGGKVQVVDTLKVESARRTLRMPDDVVKVLKRYRRTHIGALMFTSANGNPIDPKGQRATLVQLCDRADVPRVTPNELRHTAASLLLDSGAAIEQVADLLGHTTVRMLDQTYRHRVRPAVEIAAQVDWAKAK
jgi:integrase